MATATTPTSTSHSRSTSRNIPSRPTTPLRPPSRTSLRASQSTPTGGTLNGDDHAPLASLEPAFAELSDSMADLEANFLHLQLLNESISRFNENFASFLYGMNMSAFCIDFPEAPIHQSFARYKESEQDMPLQSPYQSRSAGVDRGPSRLPDTDATYLTNDTSFVENPPATSKPPSKYSAPPSSTRSRASGLGSRGSASGRARGRGGSTNTGTTTTTRGSSTRGRVSGIARGTSSRGRGSIGGIR